MDFDLSSLLAALIPTITLGAGAVFGFGLGKAKALVAKTENKLDDAIWNRLVGEFTAVGVIEPEQLDALNKLPSE